mmetsp:Transcript_3013/g.7720  ORF Transcript_3013/g.7720 Transcript_3013/m.7720 type:complete len:296 (-) Transcript_3013:28-915(-)
MESPEWARQFGVHVLGPVQLDNLHVTVLEGKRVYKPEVEEAANKNWEETLQQKPHLFDGPVWCVREWEVKPIGRLNISMQLSSFKYCLYTHHTQAGMELDPQDRAGAGGLMALVVTSDGYFLLGKRSQRVGQKPGHWHCMPAGQIDSPDIIGVLRKELKEELHVDWSDVTYGEMFGLLGCMDAGGRFEFVFKLHLKLDAATVFSQLLAAEDRSEHDAVLFVKAATQTASEWLHTGGTWKVDDLHKLANLADGSLPEQVPRVTLEEALCSNMVFTDVTHRTVQLFRELACRPPGMV